MDAGEVCKKAPTSDQSGTHGSSGRMLNCKRGKKKKTDCTEERGKEEERREKCKATLWGQGFKKEVVKLAAGGRMLREEVEVCVCGWW
jgi:hypothetical protein